MSWLRDILAVFKAPTAEAMALRQYEDCKRDLLNAQAAREAFTHQVACLTERKARLAKVVQEVSQ